jgi:hypothetical protein
VRHDSASPLSFDQLLSELVEPESRWLLKTGPCCVRVGWEIDQHLQELEEKQGETPLQEENVDAGADQ